MQGMEYVDRERRPVRWIEQVQGDGSSSDHDQECEDFELSAYDLP